MNLVRLAAISATLAAAGLPLSSSAQDVGVVVNGTALVFDQPPLERDGRIFVPLRGLFERLGASVVFDAGRIAMTAGTHTIGLHVGETTAIIDGQTQVLDAPPVVVGGRTLVPLRFVAQALGAKVAYDGTTRIVSIDKAPLAAATVATVVPPPPVPSTPMPPPAAIPPPPAIPVASAANTGGVVAPNAAFPKGEIPIELRLLRIEPAPNTTIARKRPELSGTFAESIDPASVRIAIDGRDVTADALVTARSFETDSGNDIPAGSHAVVVTGRTPDNEHFEDRWTFTTTDTPNSNFLIGLEPVAGTELGSTTFDVSGFTRPRARVRVIATTSSTSPVFSDASDDSQTVDAVATSKGYFEVPLALVDHGSGLIDVRIVSTAPGGEVAVRTLRLRL